VLNQRDGYHSAARGHVQDGVGTGDIYAFEDPGYSVLIGNAPELAQFPVDRLLVARG
jgi:hypothetical protein